MIKFTRIPFIHQQKDAFDELVTNAANHFMMDAAHVEKDYWISRILKQLSLSPYKENVYFKGGTCLFKAYGIIHRFSEDLDLYIDTNKPTSGGGPERKLNSEIYHFLKEHNLEILANDPLCPDQERGLYNRISFDSNRLYQGSELKQYLLVETTISSIKARSSIYQPYETKEIIPIIGQYLQDKGRTDLMTKLKLGSFKVNCIRPEKTLCDKISRLIKISYSENMIDDLSKHIRDVYDIHCIMQYPGMVDLIHSKEFEKGLLLTFEQDRLQHKYTHIENDFNSAQIFFNTNGIFGDARIVQSYNKLDKLLFNKEKNTLPELSSIIKTLEEFRTTISSVQKQKINFTPQF